MRRLLAFMIAAALSTQSYASTFKILGLRPLGMGGAHVAVAEGPSAQYWNPGGLALSKGSGVQVPLGFSLEATGDILQKADDVSKFSSQLDTVQSRQTNGQALSLQEVKDFNDALNRLNALNTAGTGALVGGQAGVDVRVSRLAVSLNSLVEAGAQPFADTTNVNLGAISGSGGVSLSGSANLNDAADTTARDQIATTLTNMNTNFGIAFSGGANATTAANKLVNDARTSGLSSVQVAAIASDTQALNNAIQAAGVTSSTTGNALANNASNVKLRGATLTELAFGYGHPMPIPSAFGELGVGGNAKVIRGDVGYAKIDVVNGGNTSASSVLNDYRKNTKTSYKPALDLGVLWKAPLPRRLQVGVVGRNLNGPKFDQPAAGDADGEPAFKASPQTRMGIGFWPLERIAVAADLDLTENGTSVPGFNSRMFGLGTEVRLPIVTLRGGLMKNIAQGTALSYTAGFGLSIFMVKIDAAAAISSETVRVNDGSKIPSAIQAGLTIGVQFGG